MRLHDRGDKATSPSMCPQTLYSSSVAGVMFWEQPVRVSVAATSHGSVRLFEPQKSSLALVALG